MKQRRLRHGRGGRGWRRQEEIAQSVGDNKAFGGLLVCEAPRGDLTVRGDGAQSGENGGGGHFGAKVGSISQLEITHRYLLKYKYI